MVRDHPELIARDLDVDSAPIPVDAGFAAAQRQGDLLGQGGGQVLESQGYVDAARVCRFRSFHSGLESRKRESEARSEGPRVMPGWTSIEPSSEGVNPALRPCISMTYTQAVTTS